VRAPTARPSPASAASPRASACSSAHYPLPQSAVADV
jgi:hypothetical protein